MQKLTKFIGVFFGLLASSAGLSASGRALILDYHSFLGSDSSIDVTLAGFGAELDRISSMGYRFVSLDDAMAGRMEGEDNIVITIDDGNHTVAQAYEEILRPRGIVPELFIYPAVIWRTPHFLRQDQLNALIAEGCGVGAHGYHHNYMSAKRAMNGPSSPTTGSSSSTPGIPASSTGPCRAQSSTTGTRRPSSGPSGRG